ncbi:hypothetical protein HMPREF1400_01173 [Helicobacter pylori GAM119Bi]|nr:hypothetical protein HMPREF1400_01173 [Helicobacter pylori GAM119Bi]
MVFKRKNRYNLKQFKSIRGKRGFLKIFLSCKSLLIQKSLEFYLSDCLSPMGVCDFVLSDDEALETNKPLCFIEERLRKPFTKQSVKEDVKNFYRALKESEKPCEEIKISKEQKIKQLLEEYTQKLCQIISQ